MRRCYAIDGSPWSQIKRARARTKLLRRMFYTAQTRGETPLGFRIIKPHLAPRIGLEPGRGESIQLVEGGCGTDKLDVHINVLLPGGPRGRLHRHSVSDNVYIVKSGEGELTIDGTTHRIVTDDVVFIAAGTRHALSNLSAEKLVIYEIYAPAGPAFDFVTETPTAKA